MASELSVYNPSHYPRKGHLTLPWQPVCEKIKISPERLVLSDLSDSSDTPLLFQIDRPDPEDPSRNMLSFSFAQPIPDGPDDYSKATAFVKVSEGLTSVPTEVEPKLEVVRSVENDTVRGVRLVNKRLIVWFNLIPAPENDNKAWFAGAATSIVLDGKEILDSIKAEASWEGHDPEKRCMQIDRLQLSNPLGDPDSYQDVNLFDHSYKLVSEFCGPVRATITIASEPFEYSYSDPTSDKKHVLICQLYRIISLYAGADYVIEELFIKGRIQKSGNKKAGIINPYFTARYFTHMNLGLDSQSHLYQFLPRVTDWFAVGSLLAPYGGYGFATDKHVDRVMRPHPDFPDKSDAYKTFSWQLYPCSVAKCLHLFMRSDDPRERWEIFSGSRQKGHDSLTGQRWYELIFKPLNARIFT